MNLEIGSFIGLDLKETGEYYNGEGNIARLNSARAGIFYSCELFKCHSIHIPYYLCSSVKSFLNKKGIVVYYYNINNKFEPLNIKQTEGQAVLIVNYFGLLPANKLKKLASQFKNVIIDNSAAFYCDPIKDHLNVYSTRKFFGVPDGCYVIGENAERLITNYGQDFSSETATFLLKSIELGISKAYGDRMKNEERIDNSDILRMSSLTRALLNNIDYLHIKTKRKDNFNIAHELFERINLFDFNNICYNEQTPMIYPLLLEDFDLINKIKIDNIYIGRLWKHVLNEVSEDSFEAMLSKFLVTIPIDQRYSRQELEYVHNSIVKNVC